MAFYENVRNGVIHDTETRKGWLIRMTRQTRIVERDASGNWILDRAMFHGALKMALEDWIAKLRVGNQTARDNMRRRMNEIIDKHCV
jgi:hypothetical protein